MYKNRDEKFIADYRKNHEEKKENQKMKANAKKQ